MTVVFRTQQDEKWIELAHSVVAPFQFNGGEQHLKGTGPVGGQRYLTEVRGADANYYVLAALWDSWCRRVGAQHELLVPYLPAARADKGVPASYLTYARLLDLATRERPSVYVLDPHSSVMPEVVRGCTVLPVADRVARMVENLGVSVVIAPDAGAELRARNVAMALGVPLVQASKKRDFETGELTGFECPTLSDSGRCLVVDDICDNGGTFVGLAQASGLAKERLALWVTHGAFGPRAVQLHQHFSWIGCTDSHPNSHLIDCHRIPTSKWLEEIK